MSDNFSKKIGEEGKNFICEIETYMGRNLSQEEASFFYNTVKRVGWTYDMLSEMIASGEETTGIFSIDLYMTKIGAMIQAGVGDEESLDDFKKKNETFDYLIESIRISTGKKHFSVIELTMAIYWQWEWDDSVIIAAFEYTIRKGIEATFFYVKNVLNDWKKQGVKDVDDIKLMIDDKKQTNIRRPLKRMQTRNEYQKNPLYHNFDTSGLLACPFCGGEDILLQSQYSQKADGYYCMVVCNVCGSRTRSIKNDIEVTPNSPYFWKSVVIDEVKAMWNTRV